jgi:hypothetical protein
MTDRIDGSAPWLHGSPEELDVLREGSTITQDRILARVFSHKPSLVSFDEHGAIFHNGRRAGILYQVMEEIGPADVTPVPGSTLPPGAEWLITRPVRVAPIERVEIDPEELLTKDEEAELRRRMASMRR